MMKVTFKRIGNQRAIPPNDLAWLQDNLNTPLSVASINFDSDTATPWLIAVRTPTSVVGVQTSNATYTLSGMLTTDNEEGVVVNV